MNSIKTTITHSNKNTHKKQSQNIQTLNKATNKTDNTVLIKSKKQ